MKPKWFGTFTFVGVAVSPSFGLERYLDGAWPVPSVTERLDKPRDGGGYKKDARQNATKTNPA